MTAAPERSRRTKHVVKYEPKGNPLWVTTHQAARVRTAVDARRAIALDPEGNVYVILWGQRLSRDACCTIQVSFKPTETGPELGPEGIR